MKRIVLLTDDQYLSKIYVQYLSKNGFETSVWSSLDELEKALKLLPDLIVSQCHWVNLNGAALVQSIKQKADLPVILFTNKKDDVRQAVESIRAGASDYLILPLRPEDLLHAVSKATQVQELGLAVPGTTRNSSESWEGFVGANDLFKQVIQEVKLVSKTNYSVLIFGESGTGKERIAQLIHNQSNRSEKPFVAVDCGAFSEELAKSELFGHEKGAFTGALEAKTGCFERANGGTIFLDEIANLPYSIQVALLRVIQEKKIRRIGANTDIDVDVRIVAASNENLRLKCSEERFREDLFHRLNEFSIALKPLREEPIALMQFVNFFIFQSNKELGKSIIGCSDEVIDLLAQYHWPGNLRELKNVIKQACLTAVNLIEPQNLPSNVLTSAGMYTSSAQKEVIIDYSVNSPAGIDFQCVSLKRVLLQQEYAVIKRTLEANNNNKSKAARLLKIDRKTLYKKLAMFKLYNLRVC